VTGDTLAYVSYSRTENSSALGVWRDGPGMSAIVDISTTGQINSIQREPDPWIYGHGGISKLMCFYPSQLQVIIYVITSSIQHVLSYCSTIFYSRVVPAAPISPTLQHHSLHCSSRQACTIKQQKRASWLTYNSFSTRNLNKPCIYHPPSKPIHGSELANGVKPALPCEEPQIVNPQDWYQTFQSLCGTRHHEVSQLLLPTDGHLVQSGHPASAIIPPRLVYCLSSTMGYHGSMAALRFGVPSYQTS
jgi:hypothetical protein